MTELLERPAAGHRRSRRRSRRSRSSISKGSLEGVYPGLIMANGARMEGIEADLFFTFFGLDAIRKDRHEHIKVATVGNPGLHMPTLLGALPGFSALATKMMQRQMEKLDIPPIPEFVELIADSGARPLRVQGVGRHVRPDDGRLRPAGRATSSPSASSTSSPPAARSSSRRRSQCPHGKGSPQRKREASASRSASTGTRRPSTSTSSGAGWTSSSSTVSTTSERMSPATIAVTTGKIARAHLNEFPDYYTRLEQMEEQAKREHGST